MRRMEKITGRSDDMMIVRGVNVFPTQIEEKLLAVPVLSAHYQIVLSREGRMDQMEILVEIRPGRRRPGGPQGGRRERPRQGDQGPHWHHGPGECRGP